VVNILVAAGLGLAIGAATGFVLAILQITSKRIRNARLAARGEPGVKDVVLIPLWYPFGVLGLVIGLVGALVR
jgi:hypothetical protein